jgi:hypothetical protein
MAIPSSTDAARPFLPAKDFETSREFYEVLGFSKLLDGDVAVFGVGPSAFILQRYYQKDWAENFMMQLMVEDLDGWWEHIEALDLPGRFGVKPPKAPTFQSWGLRVAYLYDPSGVLGMLHNAGRMLQQTRHENGGRRPRVQRMRAGHGCPAFGGKGDMALTSQNVRL